MYFGNDRGDVHGNEQSNVLASNNTAKVRYGTEIWQLKEAERRKLNDLENDVTEFKVARFNPSVS